MTFYTAPLFSYCPIRFSDIGCFILLYLSVKNNYKIKVNTNSIVALLLILWCIADSIILSVYPFFSILNHYTQFVRLLLALILYIYLPNLWDNFSLRTIVLVLKRVLIIHLVIQVLYGIIYYCGITGIFNIISTYEQRSGLITSNYLFFNHFIIVNTSSGAPRFSGVFEEPAWFGWTLNLIIAIILQYQYKSKSSILCKRDYGLIFIGYFLTSSVSAILSLLVIIGTYFYLNNKRHKFKILLVTGGLIGSIVAIIFTLSHSLFDRLAIIAAGNDGSSNFRLIGSWNSLMTLLANDPLTGYGLGDDNKSHYYEGLSSHSFHGITINGAEILDMHNMLFQIICNLGVLGGILFLLLLHGLSFKKSLIVIISIGLTYFTVNVFNNFFFFTIISIATYYWGIHETRDRKNFIISK